MSDTLKAQRRTKQLIKQLILYTHDETATLWHNVVNYNQLKSYNPEGL